MAIKYIILMLPLLCATPVSEQKFELLSSRDSFTDRVSYRAFIETIEGHGFSLSCSRRHLYFTIATRHDLPIAWRFQPTVEVKVRFDDQPAQLLALSGVTAVALYGDGRSLDAAIRQNRKVRIRATYAGTSIDWQFRSGNGRAASAHIRKGCASGDLLEAPGIVE